MNLPAKFVAASLLAWLMLMPGIVAAQDKSESKAAGEVNSSSSSAASTPADSAQPEHVVEDETVLHADQLRWERLFTLVIQWGRTATRMRAEGGPSALAGAIEDRLQKKARLSEDQAEQVVAVARQWQQNLADTGRERLAVVAKVRAEHPGEHMDRTNSKEIRAMYLKRWKLTDDSVAALHMLLGEAAFGQLEKFSYEAGRYAL